MSGEVESILRALRRGQRQLTRNPHGAVEAAVTQLLALRPGHHDGATDGPSTESRYRLEELAEASGVTARNIRAYQERGLLHAPTKQGRVVLFDDTHLARLKVITSMLERGYTSAHITEMIAAWEAGLDLSHVLGVESALLPPAGSETPETVTLVEARKRSGGAADLDAFVAAGLVELRGRRAVLARPQLLRAFAEMRSYGMTNAQLLALHEAVVPEVDRVTELLVAAGAHHVAHLLEIGDDTTSADVTDVVDMLRRFRLLAMTSVTATLSDSLDRTIEGVLADYLARFVEEGEEGADSDRDA